MISDFQTKLKNSDESYSVLSKCFSEMKNNVKIKIKIIKKN